MSRQQQMLRVRLLLNRGEDKPITLDETMDRPAAQQGKEEKR